MLYPEEFVYTNELKKAFYPVGSGKGVQQIKLDGRTVYTSEKLKENVKESVRKKLPFQVARIISEQIDYGKVIPVFLTKGIIDYVIKRRKFRTHARGFEQNGISYVFVDTMYQKFKLTSVDEYHLATIILHELLHVAEYSNRTAFYRVNGQLFIQFWKHFFTHFLKLKGNLPDKPFQSMIRFQVNKVEKKKAFSFYEMYKPLINQLREYSKLNDYDYKNFWDYFISEAVNNRDREQDDYNYSNIPEAADYAYKKLTGKKTTSFSQEMWYSGEILSMVGTLNPKHPNVLKTLQIIK
ncbi:MAG: hypothetical protein R3267_07520 [Paenisporosarcina sp.]|nr:hypothetical protein [Paenisporosarcina sp.]